MPYAWEEFTDYLDGTRPITAAERDELWTALASLLEECGGRWRLVDEDMDAIKASRLATDKTSLVNEAGDDFRDGDLAVILIDIEDTFSGTTGYDAFKAVADDEGLTEEQLGELVSESGRVTSFDTWHLWNLYKRVLTYLRCCPTVLPSIRADTSTASKRCSGFLPFDNMGTDPSAWGDTLYRTMTEDQSATYGYSGFVFGNINPIADSPCAGCCVRYDVSVSWVLNATITREFAGALGDGGFSDTRSPDYTEPAGTARNIQNVTGQDGCNPDCHNEIDETTDVDFGGNAYYYTFVDGDVSGPTSMSGEATTTIGGQSGATACDDPTPKSLPGILEQNASRTLSNPVTLAAMIAGTAAAAPDYPGTWLGVARSSVTVGKGRPLWYNYHDAFFDIEVIKSRWSAVIPTDLSEGKLYRLVYMIRFTPQGGSAVDGEEEHLDITWDGEAEFTENRDVPVPTEAGVNELILLRWECPDE